MSYKRSYQPQWIREDFIDFIAEKVNPIWAWKKVKAQVIHIECIGTDFYQIQLRPNSNFKYPQFQAGQSLLVTLTIEGIRNQRSYSVLKLLSNGDLIIAVKQQGHVSKALTQLPISAVVELSQTQGDFVLNHRADAILLLASGSGITAIYALLQQAMLLHNIQKIDLIYFSRDQAFVEELTQLAEAHQHFNFYHFNTSKQRQRFSKALLTRLVPDFGQRETYLCGANRLMVAVNDLYQTLGIAQHLKQEFFQHISDENASQQPVYFQRSQQNFDASSNLLESAEQAGLRPAHGCRMGICNSCSCTKVSGSVKNLLTGEINHADQTQIKLCISQAVSPVVINL